MTRHGVLALDQGGHGSRAVVFDERGVAVAEAQQPIRTVHGPHGEIEHEPAELARSLQQAADSALAQAPHLRVSRAGLATQRSTVVCWRADGIALSPAISWQDRRNAGWLAHLAAQAPRITALTGLPLSPHYGAGKIRWCLDHVPAVRAAAAAGELIAGPLAAFLCQRLVADARADSGAPAGRGTSAARADPANASRTLLWSADTRDWCEELLQLFGVERRWLPRCVPTRTDFGPIATGDITLTACSGDQSAIPFAFGTPEPTDVYVNLGTGAFLQRPLPQRPPDAQPLLASVLGGDEARAWFSLEGTVNGAGSATAWFARHAGTEEAPLWSALELLPENAVLPVFVNAVGGLGSPWWRPDLESRFVGVGDRPAQFAAVVESITFLIADNLALMRADAPPRRIVLTGGLSRSDWLCRRLASVLGLPVARGLTEATARGTAALAAPELAANWEAPPLQIFDPAPNSALSERHQRFEQALRALL
jgi:glycerol kinase